MDLFKVRNLSLEFVYPWGCGGILALQRRQLFLIKLQLAERLRIGSCNYRHDIRFSNDPSFAHEHSRLTHSLRGRVQFRAEAGNRIEDRNVATLSFDSRAPLLVPIEPIGLGILNASAVSQHLNRMSFFGG